MKLPPVWELLRYHVNPESQSSGEFQMEVIDVGVNVNNWKYISKGKWLERNNFVAELIYP